MEALRASKNQDGDIKAALEALKKENGYLFEDDPPARYASGTGTQQMTGQNDAPTSLAGALHAKYDK